MPHLTGAAPERLVEDIMIKTVHRIRPDMKVHDVIELLIRYQISGAPVVDTLENVMSVVSEGDLLRLAAQHGLDATIASCLPHLPAIKELVTIQAQQTFLDAYRLFLTHKLHRLIVVDANGRLHGLVTRADILRIFCGARFGKALKRSS